MEGTSLQEAYNSFSKCWTRRGPVHGSARQHAAGPTAVDHLYITRSQANKPGLHRHNIKTLGLESTLETVAADFCSFVSKYTPPNQAGVVSYGAIAKSGK